MIRFVLVLLFVLCYLIIGIPILLVEWIIGKVNPQAKAKQCLALAQWGFRVIKTISGVKMTVIGQENIPKDQAVLYVSNHRSYFDVILTYMLVERPTGYIAKTEMLRYPLLRDWMKNLYCTFLDRKDIKQGLQLILQNIDYLKNGISVCVYPEGTRNKSDEILLPFHDGSLKMADKSGAPIIPVTVNNTEQIFEAHMPKIKRAHVVIEYGAPIYMKDMSREEKKTVSKQVQQILIDTYQKNAELI